MMIMTAAPVTGRTALGGDAASVTADRQSMKGTLAAEQRNGYTVDTIKTPAGLAVREYLSSGSVFAVTWSGPLLPDLRQLLGGYFDRYLQAARDARARHGRRSALAIQQPDLVVHSGGHMRSFVGRAYLPAMVPSGVDAEALP